MLHTEEYELLPNIDDMLSFSSDSDLTRLPYLSECDIDEQMPQIINSRYYTIPELAAINSNAKQLSILHTNIRSISLHRDEIVHLCARTQKPFDVIGVSETWNSVQSEIVADIDINGYKRYETTSLSQNGGVGIYVKTSLSSSKRDDLTIKCDGFETVWIEVKNRSTKNFLFCCLYRHPRSDINTLILHFNTILPQLTNKQVFIMGDFNINSLNYDSHTPTFDFMNTLFSNNFLPCITHPTRISNNSATIIDNIFTNLTNSKITSGNILTHISDHFPQFLILENINISHKKQELLKRDYSSFNGNSLLSDFTMLDLHYLKNDNSINHIYDKFLEDVTNLVDKHVPLIKCTKKESKLKMKPWINHRIQKIWRSEIDF